jgi:DNA-3-methyladenine glycosylase II
MATKNVMVGQKRHLTEGDLHHVVDGIFATNPTSSTITKSGWCLREGLTHIMSVDNGRMLSIVQQHGLPMIYEATMSQTCRHEAATNDTSAATAADENLNQLKSQPQDCFQSLCRIVAGQQLAGAAAKTVWNRLQEATGYNLSPAKILDLANKGVEQHLQKPAGLSGAKARSIVALAKAFQGSNAGDDNGNDDVHLSDTFLTTGEDSEVREALLRVKGIGPWSCDMFMMFYLERANILPVGDLGVRKGMAKLFQLRGKAKNGSLCPKNDLQLIENTLKPYRPYQSLVAYYMWRVADTKDVYNDKAQATTVNSRKKKKVDEKMVQSSDITHTTDTPKKKRLKRAMTRQVTP